MNLLALHRLAPVCHQNYFIFALPRKLLIYRCGATAASIRLSGFADACTLIINTHPEHFSGTLPNDLQAFYRTVLRAQPIAETLRQSLAFWQDAYDTYLSGELSNPFDGDPLCEAFWSIKTCNGCPLAAKVGENCVNAFWLGIMEATSTEEADEAWRAQIALIQSTLTEHSA